METWKQLEVNPEKHESNGKTVTFSYKAKPSFTVYISLKKTHAFYILVLDCSIRIRNSEIYWSREVCKLSFNCGSFFFLLQCCIAARILISEPRIQ